MIEFIPGRKYLVQGWHELGTFVGEFVGRKGDALIFSNAIELQPFNEEPNYKLPVSTLIDAEPWLQCIEPADTTCTPVAREALKAIAEDRRVVVQRAAISSVK